MINIYETISFIVYFIFLIWVGIHFYKKNKDIDDYILGRKQLGKWVTALSAQASDMSGWLLMGLPGAVYLYGLGESWIAIGLFIGTFLNWLLIAPRLRAYTGRTNSLTLPHFFEERFADPSGLLRMVSAFITIFFFTIYAASGLNATGKLFEQMFNFPFGISLAVAGTVIILHTFLGGYMGVCWTDLFQGTLMLAAVIVVPVMAWIKIGGLAGLVAASDQSAVSLSLIPNNDAPIRTIISAASWGLGYCGMPHILCRFMSVKSVKELKPAMVIAVVWVVLSLAFSVIIGITGMAMFPELLPPSNETVFILMARQMFPPIISGIIMAAILSAIMSTIDSQLLVSSSILTEDLNKKIIKKELNDSAKITIGRMGVIIISIIAMIIASNKDSSILGLVEYAWGGLGAAFGPVIIMALYSKNTNWKSALLGMCLGFLTIIIWERLGYSKYMYEILPGFFINLITIFIANIFWKETDLNILQQFDSHMSDLKE